MNREEMLTICAVLPPSRIYHVFPTFGREHETKGRGSCWCEPDIEIVEPEDGGEPCGAVIVHNTEH